MKKIKEIEPLPVPYFMNTDEKFLRKGGRKAPFITMEEFKNVLNLKYIKECKKDEWGDTFKPSSNQAETDIEKVAIVLRNCVSKDYDKIEYDDENTAVDIVNFQIKGTELNRLQITSAGIPYLGFYCGGDAGGVLFLIIYWDGKKLRGYIPIAGNTVKADNTVFASGYSDDDETIELLNGGSTTDEEYNAISENVGIDFDWIAKDIESRIVAS